MSKEYKISCLVDGHTVTISGKYAEGQVLGLKIFTQCANVLTAICQKFGIDFTQTSGHTIGDTTHNIPLELIEDDPFTFGELSVSVLTRQFGLDKASALAESELVGDYQISFPV